MGIFRQFPYSNFHELNLDWLLNKMKDLSAEFDNLIDEFNNFTINIPKYISKFVDEWFKDHPEAVNPLNYDNSLIGNTYTPIYIGDIVDDYEVVPSSFAIVNNYIYILCWYRHSDNGEGKVFRIDPVTNRIIDTFETYLCHCNSCASVINRNAHYIAKSQISEPDGTIVRVNGIIKYDTLFSSYVEIGMDQAWLGVSYDNITDKLYAYEIDGSLYEILDDDTFELIGTINEDNIANYNQDIAIHNNVVLLSSYSGDVIKFNINDLSTHSYGFIEHYEGTGRYYIDENEGWEFVGAELYCVGYSKHRTVSSFGFLTKIVSGATKAKAPDSNVAGSHFTAEIKADRMDTFCMLEHEFKHPNQLNTSPIKFTSLNIDNDTNFGDVYITNNIAIIHCLVCDNLIVRTSDIYFESSGDDIVDIGTINLYYRGGKLTFAGEAYFTYHVDDIIYGNSASEIVVRRNITIEPYAFGEANLVTPLKCTMSAYQDDLKIPPIQHTILNASVTINAGSFVSTTVDVPKISDIVSRFVFDSNEYGLTGSVNRSDGGTYWRCYVTICNHRATNVTLTTFRLLEFLVAYNDPITLE